MAAYRAPCVRTSLYTLHPPSGEGRWISEFRLSMSLANPVLGIGDCLDGLVLIPGQDFGNLATLEVEVLGVHAVRMVVGAVGVRHVGNLPCPPPRCQGGGQVSNQRARAMMM